MVYGDSQVPPATLKFSRHGTNQIHPENTRLHHQAAVVLHLLPLLRRRAGLRVS